MSRLSGRCIAAGSGRFVRCANGLAAELMLGIVRCANGLAAELMLGLFAARMGWQQS